MVRQPIHTLVARRSRHKPLHAGSLWGLVSSGEPTKRHGLLGIDDHLISVSYVLAL